MIKRRALFVCLILILFLVSCANEVQVSEISNELVEEEINNLIEEKPSLSNDNQNLPPLLADYLAARECGN